MQALTRPLRHALPDAEFAGDPVHAHAGGAKLPGAGERLVRGCRTPEALALSACSGEACHRPVHENSPLEFGEDAEHLEHGAARGRRGVQPLEMQEQVNPGRVQIREEADKVLQRSPESVHGPRHDHIELPARDVLEHRVERRALVAALRAADALVFIYSLDPPAHAGRNGGQLALLVLGGLVGGGDADIKGNTAHRRHSSFRGALNRNRAPIAVQAKVTRKWG